MNFQLRVFYALRHFGKEQSYNYGFHSERIKIASYLARTTVFVLGILQFAYSLPSGFSRRKKMNCKLNSGFLCASSLRGTKQSYNYGFHSERIKIASCLARTTVCVGYFANCLFIAVRFQPTDKKKNCKLNSGFFMRFVILRYEAILNYGFHSERIKIASCLARTTICVMGILHFAHSLPSGFSRRIKKRIANSTQGFLCASSLRGTQQSYNYGFHSERIKIASCLARTTVCVLGILQFAYSLPFGFSRRIKNKTRAIIYNPGFDVFGKKGFSFSALFFQLKLCFSLISISAEPTVVTSITRFAAHVSITATSFATTATFRLCLWFTFNLIFGQHTFPG